MRRSKRRERGEATVTRLRPISPWLVTLAVMVIAAVTVPLTFWLYGIAGDDPNRRLETIKIGSTMAAGLGGFFALLLAFRRQRSTEMIAVETREARDKEYEQRDRVAQVNERDAEQRRITELYTKAADQLGSEKAPVRLAGLYALERLAQNTPDQRQTIVDVIGAYLRMPYTPPDKQAPGEDAPDEARIDYEHRRQELQVRMTAQRILETHLMPEAVDTFWTGIDLDLTQAHLHQLDLSNCHIRTAQFNRAHFAGEAKFNGAHFYGDARFRGARFGIDAEFNHANFHETASFDEARFGKYARFQGAHFRGAVSFEGARFGGGNTEAYSHGDELTIFGVST